MYLRNICSLYYCVYNSAKVAENNEITAQSNYVIIHSDGSCVWEPRFDESITQCHIDVIWFPFDQQTCDLVFESWMLQNSVIHLNAAFFNLWSSVQPQGWTITGVCKIRLHSV